MKMRNSLKKCSASALTLMLLLGVSGYALGSKSGKKIVAAVNKEVALSWYNVFVLDITPTGGLCFMRFDANTLSRFWSKVDKNCAIKCWLWKGNKNQHGYGRLRVKTESGWKMILASRISFEIHKGPLGDTEKVLHACDTPSCVNPECLTKGSQLDNVLDAVRKGRHPAGERNGRATLTWPQVDAIRALVKQRKDLTSREMKRLNLTNTAIAKEFGISIHQVGEITNHKHWRRP